MRRLAAATSVVVFFAAHSSLAWAQGGWYAFPAFRLTEEYRSNVFGTPTHPDSDFITRFTTVLAVGYVSAPFTLVGGYAFSAEVYADHADLDDALAQQAAGLTVTYLPNPRLTLSGNLIYRATNDATRFLFPLGEASTAPPAPSAGQPTAGAPAPSAGAASAAGSTAAAADAGGPTSAPSQIPAVNVGRHRASALQLGPAASYQVDPRTTTQASYGYSRTFVAGGPSDESHAVGLSVSRRFTAVDEGSLAYRGQVFTSDQSEGSGGSHALLVGWTRQFTPAFTGHGELGPRFDSDGSTDVGAGLRLDYKIQQASFSLSYDRSEGLVVGRAGGAHIDAVAAAARYQPLPDLTLGLTTGVTWTSDARGRRSGAARRPSDTVFGVGAFASYRLTQWLTARLSYQFSRDEQSRTPAQPGTGSQPDTPAQPGTTVDAHSVILTLELSYPVRLD